VNAEKSDLLQRRGTVPPPARAENETEAGFCFRLPARSAPPLSSRWLHLADGLSSTDADAFSRLMPTLLCGEESATVVFHREGLSGRASEAGQRVLAKLEHEEEVHSLLLSQFRSELPLPGDLAEVRRRARGFFLRIGVAKPSTIFSRIVEIDSAVCIIMHALLAPDAIPAPCVNLRALFGKIRREEATHVRAVQGYLAGLGDEVNRDFAAMVRDSLVEMLRGVADSFEAIRVDPDRLFGRIGDRSRNVLPNPT